MKNILLTGGAGFIGSHLARSVRADRNLSGHRLIVLDDLSGGYTENIPEDDSVEFVKGSILDQALVQELFAKHQFDYVFHLAAYAAEGLSHFIRRFNYNNNLIGSVNLLNEAVKTGTKRFLFTSSIAVYGSAEPPMTEATPPDPEDPYGIAKYAFEMDLKVARDMFGLDYVIFRPHNVYGEYQNIADRYRNVVGIFMNQILKGEPMTVFGDGEQSRAFTYIGDITPVMAAAATAEECTNCIFNVGADQPCSVNELAAHVAKAMGKPDHPVKHLTARNEVVAAFADHTAIKKVFPDSEQTSLADGLRRMVDWVNVQGARASSIFENIEITQNLPPSWQVKPNS